MIMRDRFIRLQTHLKEASGDLDDASAENIAALEREADRLIRERARTSIARASCSRLPTRPRPDRPTPARRAAPAAADLSGPAPQGGGPGGRLRRCRAAAPTVAP